MLNTNFDPGSGRRALLDQIADLKFSKHTPLVVCLVGMIFALYRTFDYLTTQAQIGWFVAGSFAVFIELLLTAASALIFLALRAEYVAELKDEDRGMSRPNLYVGIAAMLFAFLALLGIAILDARRLTNGDLFGTAIFSLIQLAQSAFFVSFINASYVDERAKLRERFHGYLEEQKRVTGEREKAQRAAAEEEARRKARQCPHCFIEVAPNNRKRHVESCPARPPA